jgi:membrane protein DedA with SNARE-associated domain
MSHVDFLVAVAIGRAIRFFGVGLLALWKGQAAIEWLHENAATVGIVLAAAVVIFAAVSIWRRKRRGSGLGTRGSDL